MSADFKCCDVCRVVGVRVLYTHLSSNMHRVEEIRVYTNALPYGGTSFYKNHLIAYSLKKHFNRIIPFLDCKNIPNWAVALLYLVERGRLAPTRQMHLIVTSDNPCVAYLHQACKQMGVVSTVTPDPRII